MTKPTGPRIDWNFNERVACALDQHGDESMHSLERNERADTFATHRFKCATCVAHSVFRVPAANGVGDRNSQSLYQRVFALGAITTDKIGPARDLAEKPRDIGRIILQIAIDKNHGHATGGLEPGINGRALSRILFKLDQSNVRSGFDSLRRAIR